MFNVSTGKYFWTKHSLAKMRFYGLSQQRVKRVIRSPQRIEEGIVKNTIAVMQPPSFRNVNGKKTWSQEIWAMYQIKSRNPKSEIRNANEKLKNLLSDDKQIKIISAWRYPGVSPKNNPIPEEILNEIQENFANFQ